MLHRWQSVGPGVWPRLAHPPASRRGGRRCLPLPRTMHAEQIASAIRVDADADGWKVLVTRPLNSGATIDVA